MIILSDDDDELCIIQSTADLPVHTSCPRTVFIVDDEEEDSFILSFDIGTKNLAMAAAKIVGDGLFILASKLFAVNFKGDNAGNVAVNIIGVVDDVLNLFSAPQIKQVIIERQMIGNMRGVRTHSNRPMMSSLICAKNSRIECALHTAFKARGVLTKVVSPIRMHSCVGYKNRKRESVNVCKDLITKRPDLFHQDVKDFFCNAKKKDDLADSILLVFEEIEFDLVSKFHNHE